MENKFPNDNYIRTRKGGVSVWVKGGVAEGDARVLAGSSDTGMRGVKATSAPQPKKLA